MTDKLASQLRDVPLFSGLSDAQRVKLAGSASMRSYAQGVEIFSVGEPADSFLLVLSGAVKVYLLSADGREQILHLAHSGDLIAEGAVFAQGTYPAGAMATHSADVAHFYRDRLVELLREDPELSLGMIAGLSRRLRQFVVTIEDLSLRDITTRLARFLSGTATDGVCTLPGTKTQLAAQLGTVLEPLSRAFRRLKQSGMIQERNGIVRILDEEALRTIVDGL